MHNKQLILAHRGYSGIAPENTDLAFQTAYNFAFDGVELDVHLTKDKKLVIIHDETTNRTALTNKEIEFSTLADLKKDDHSKFFKLNTRKQEIMTLEEFLDKYLDLYTVINVEIKTDQKKYLGIEEKLHALSKKYGQKYFEKIIFSSFNFQSLRNMRKLSNKYLLAYLFWTETQFKKVPLIEIKEICHYINPWIVLYDKNKEKYKNVGLPIILWTIKNKNKYMEYVNDKSVYAQISNYKFEQDK
ncbi:glycerophosphodiester phosphodiesterase family protein [Mycoplasma phocimorsus]|uniref:Glycerophosphodiester phosphodiesterase family protein n=1 Tax=Mycoplasma phocimorsus TaxID=3045839 RepID=A0AAJ1UZD2_9MOLU|nr:glycerophosphodiester phosphodiesterase family protein [Mycoplasma phocimorsus]MDJ1645613.1 glycerophosphodiester phosphodiesterase family protein [Mycoplasma phocimorsus]MDJ1646125.1 glycerophosphodiester phosphodiesterase family protein [Mycoplasma phocimorsus]MDJ1647147.1 glycerophosphodiester phosphodiesterase family protein [Mycoplasma phocimorsus]MDJ1647667.1 glycerophosphodiester phosphodiesterase family protein [Mycoplasma phocimorsus]MDJ1648235.1 glycerophosphodiester phosphodieste